jgi:hypothetical protein
MNKANADLNVLMTLIAKHVAAMSGNQLPQQQSTNVIGIT